MSDFKGKVAIIGIGEVPSGKFPDRPCLQSCVEASRQAISDAGIDKNHIDVVMPKKYWDDFRVGDGVMTQAITITDTHLVNWAGLTMDFFRFTWTRSCQKDSVWI